MTKISSRLKAFSTVCALATLAAGCASRSVPHAHSQASAASASAPPAPPAVISRALEGDPPLPGPSTLGWTGLAPTSRTTTPGRHAGHQHGTPGAPAATTPDHSVQGTHDGAPLPAMREAQVADTSEKDAKGLLAKPLDADTAVRIALLHNRELRARLRELGVAQGRVLQAGLVANPLFEVELLPERDSNVELRAEYEITSLLMAPMKRRAAQHDLEAARIEVAGEVVQLGYEVRTAFYALQTAEQRLAFAQQSLDALAAGRDAARALVEAGNVNQLDASTQIVGYERARIAVAQIELEVAALREGLQRILALHGPETSWTLDPQLRAVPKQPPALQDLERQAIQANLELRAAEKRLAALARRTGIARTQGWLPEVAVDVHTLRTNREARDDSEWRWGGGVSVEFPLFDHGQGERRGYEAQFDALLERYQGLAIDLRSAARETSNRLRSAHARARQYETVILPAQAVVMEQTLLQYNAMQLGVFQLLEARRGLLDVQLAYADTVREYWSAQAEYEALLSGRLVKAATRSSSNQAISGSSSQGGH